MTRLFLLFALFSLNAHSQSFTVEADRIALPYDRTSSSTVVIEKDQFKNATTLNEVLGQVSGLVSFENGPYGGSTTYFLRGFGRGQVKIYLDGVEIVDPSDVDRSMQLQHFPLSGLKRIEVIKGSQGALYGADASGGVILLTTDDEVSASLYTSFASNETWSGGFYARDSTKDWSLMVSGDLILSEGISAYNEARIGPGAEKDFYKRTALNFAIDHKKSKVGLKVKSVDAKQDIDNSFSGDIINNDLSKYTHRIYSLHTDQDLNAQWKIKATSAYSEIKRTVQTNGFEADTKQARIEVHWLASANSASVYFMDYSKESADTSSEFKDKKQESLAFGASHNLSLEKFFSDQSLRLDKAQAYAARASGRLGLGYNVTKSLTLKTQAATGFKAPTLYQRFSGFGGREDLKATRTRSIQVSTLYQRENHNYELAVFSNSAGNLVDYDQANSVYENVGETHTYGAEWSSSYKLKSFEFLTSYTWMKARNKITGADLARRPRWFGTLGVNYSFNEKWDLRFSHKAVSKRQDEGKLPYYDLYNLGTSWKLSPQKILDFDLANIFDRQYESVRYYGTLGRNFRLQLRWSL